MKYKLKSRLRLIYAKDQKYKCNMFPFVSQISRNAFDTEIKLVFFFQSSCYPAHRRMRRTFGKFSETEI